MKQNFITNDSFYRHSILSSPRTHSLRIGIEIEARGFPGSRSLAMANRRGIDGELYRGELNKDEVPNLIRIPVPIMYGEIVVFTKDVGAERPAGINLKDFQGIKALEPPLQRDAIYHYLNNSHLELVPKITAVLKAMEEEGLIQRITEETEAEFLK